MELELLTDIQEEAADLIRSAACHVVNSQGERWLFCCSCGRVALSGEFKMYGGRGLFINSGICEKCFNEKWR